MNKGILRRVKGEIDQLSIVEWLDFGVGLVGLFLGLVSVFGSVGLAAVDPEPADAAGSDLLLVWTGFAVFYCLAFINSFIFRRYRVSAWARPYPLPRQRSIVHRNPLDTIAGIPVPELWERLLLAALTSVIFLFSFVYIAVGPPTPDSLFPTRMGNTAFFSSISALFFFPAIAIAGRVMDMIIAGLTTSARQR